MDLNIDGTISSPGKKWVSGHASGTVRLRVYDTDYSDNSGAYSVTLVVVPEAAFKGSDCARVDASGVTPCRVP